MARIKLVICLVFLTSFVATVVLAQEFNSASFVNSDPVVSLNGEKSTSASFQLVGGSGQIIIGESSSTAFTSHAGFFYFPQVTTPILSATAGDSQVSLSWTSAVGSLGFNISGYSVGRATSSGGPFTFTAVGNVLANTVTGLANGTTYYFVVKALDSFGDATVASSQVSAVPVGSVSPPSGGGGGGGGGAGTPTIPQTIINFSGRAYPKSTITLLKDAQIAASSIAGTDANFQITLTGVSAGNYNFAIYSEDKDGRRSSLLTFPVGVTTGATTNISGIFIAPTISVDKSEVKRGENIAIFGQSAPKADIIISVNSEEEFFAKTISDANGAYLYNFDTTMLEQGSHSTKSKASIGNQDISGFGYSVNFKVSNKTVPTTGETFLKADVNKDGKVNLVDFSIAAYWYKRSLSAVFKPTEKGWLNGDGKVDLVDMSIIAYYWTG